MTKPKKEQTKLEKEIEKKLTNLISNLKTYIPKENYFLFEGRIGNLMDLEKKRTKKLMYDYYFKRFKNPVIMEKKEFDRLRRLDNGK